MPNEDAPNARQANALKARQSMDPDTIRGRSRGIYEVLRMLADAGKPILATEIAKKLGTQLRNANRMLLSLKKYGQVQCVEQPREPVELEDGRIMPIKKGYIYRITERGIGRMKWLMENKPWER